MPRAGGRGPPRFVSGFLARLLLDPPSESLHALLGRRADPPLVHDGLDARVEAVARLLRDDDPTELAKEWTRLFVGPRFPPCRPWHDTWECEGPPRLMGPKHASMLALYRRAGLEPVTPRPSRRTTSGLVLALFSALAERAAGGEDVSALLGELWDSHVATWLPRFAATLVAEAKVPSLKAAGELLLEAVSPGAD
jgi:putative dimethyl sulfoxide reductase chaperone